MYFFNVLLMNIILLQVRDEVDATTLYNIDWTSNQVRIFESKQ